MTDSIESEAYELWSEYRRIHEYLDKLPELEELRAEAKAAVGQTPAETVYTESGIRLLRYTRDTPATQPRPLLIVPSLVNRYWIMDLLPGESFVEGMLARGFEVFIVDWGAPNAGHRHLDLAHYLNRYLRRAVRRTLRAAGAKQLDLAGYCLGGTMALLYALLDGGDQVARLTTMVAPTGFKDSGLLSWWAQEEHFSVDSIVSAHGNVPADFFSSSFPWLVPTAKLRNLRLMYERHEDRGFMRSFLALDHWLADQVDFPGKVYREFIVNGYQQDVLVETGEWPLGDDVARLAALKVPTLAMGAQYDHVAPSASCLRLTERAPAGMVAAEEHPAGHLSFALGKDMRGQPTPVFWDRVAAHSA